MEGSIRVLIIEIASIFGVQGWFAWLTQGLSPLQVIILCLTGFYTIVRIVKLFNTKRSQRGLNP